MEELQPLGEAQIVMLVRGLKEFSAAESTKARKEMDNWLIQRVAEIYSFEKDLSRGSDWTYQNPHCSCQVKSFGTRPLSDCSLRRCSARVNGALPSCIGSS